MPELPEVETVVRNLRPVLVGHVIQGMWHDWGRVLQHDDPVDLADRMRGQRFRAVERRAKYILCHLDHDTLVFHLKMTGRLYVTDAHAQHDADRWVHFRLDLDGGKQLRFSDARKFGRVYLTPEPNAFTEQLGPEPLDNGFTLHYLKEIFASRKRAIKPLLMDQTLIAGIGNIYADESLFRAGVHPLRPANSLTEAEIQRLHGTIRDALQAGIDHEGASINWYRKPDGSKGESQNHFLVYGQQGKPCQVCGTELVKIRVAQRGTHYCPTCQPLDNPTTS